MMWILESSVHDRGGNLCLRPGKFSYRRNILRNRPECASLANATNHTKMPPKKKAATGETPAQEDVSMAEASPGAEDVPEGALDIEINEQRIRIVSCFGPIYLARSC